MLNDAEIKSLALTQNLITPFNPDLLQPASYDLTLGSTVLTIPKEVPQQFVVGKDQVTYVEHVIGADDAWLLPPRGFALFETAETILLPNDTAGKFEGKSSLGRIGLMTHITAGFIDPGFRGVLTLELYNAGPMSLALRPGIRIGQVSFHRLSSPVLRPYGHPDLGSHYQDSDHVQGGKFD